MNPIVTVIVALLNALGALLPQLPGFIASIRGSAELTAEGKAVLDTIEGRVDRHVEKLDDVKPLPVPDPKPTRPE